MICRHRLLRLVISALAVLTGASCGATTPTISTTAAPTATAERIVVTAPGLLGITSPTPEGMIWTLSATSNSTTLCSFSLVPGSAQSCVPVGQTTTTIAGAPLTGTISIGAATPHLGSVEFLTTSSGSLLATIPVKGAVVSLAETPDGSAVIAVVRIRNDYFIRVYNASSFLLERSIPTTSATIAAVAPSSFSSIWILQNTGNIVQLSPTGTVLGNTQGPSTPITMTLNATDNDLFILSGNENIDTVTPMTITTGAVGESFPVLPDTVAIQISFDGSTLYDAVGLHDLGEIALLPVPHE